MNSRLAGNDAGHDVSVIYSFKSRWSPDIEAGNISVFFRKRGPSQKPRSVFIYVGAPISSVVAVAEVDRMETVNLTRSIELAKLGCITADELRTYIGVDGQAKAIFLKNHQNLSKPLGINELRRLFNFHPPQNFVQVSKDLAEKILDASNAKETH